MLAEDETLTLARDGECAWVHRAPPGTVLDLEDVIVGRAFQRNGIWRYDTTLLIPPRPR